jgi:hypothetical protein
MKTTLFAVGCMVFLCCPSMYSRFRVITHEPSQFWQIILGCDPSGPLVSNVWTSFDLADLHEGVTVGEAAQPNVVVFDLGMKRGDF